MYEVSFQHDKNIKDFKSFLHVDKVESGTEVNTCYSRILVQ